VYSIRRPKPRPRPTSRSSPSIDLATTGSDPPRAEAWATVDAAADDVAAALHHFDLGAVGVVGWSAGGRVAAALAARHPELVERLAIVATPAPHEEVPWVPPELMAGVEALRELPPAAAHSALAEQMSRMIPGDPSDPAALQLLGVGPGDDAVLALPGARERIVEMLRAAFEQGAVGMAADVAGYTMRPWGFEPEDIETTALLLYGADDPVVGEPHARWWSSRLRRADVQIMPGVGHLVVIPAWGRILAHVAPAVARRA
jgi:pimeloyl-ACP methyl ester carboxylesterase